MHATLGQEGKRERQLDQIKTSACLQYKPVSGQHHLDIRQILSFPFLNTGYRRNTSASTSIRLPLKNTRSMSIAQKNIRVE